MNNIKKTKRIGETSNNNQGIEMTIINYKNNSDIDIQFSDGTVVEHVQYYNFINGNVKNYNIPSYLGKGYLGYGQYTSRVDGIKTEEYVKWGSMLTRCYSEKFHEKENYKDCIVCDEWHNFQNFAKWYYENKYMPPFDDRLELDKDIKIKNNKIYSPETCLLVPKRINSTILNRKNDRGNCCIGVSRHGDKYIAHTNPYGGMHTKNYIGTFDTEEEAFYAYKKCKEKIIKEIAENYKPYIPYEVYDALIRYEININD